MSDIPWTFGPGALGAEPALWSRSAEDPRPDEAEHGALFADARSFVRGFAASHGAELAELAPGDLDVRGDFFGDRTEELVVNTERFAEHPKLVTELVRQTQEFLSQKRWQSWRFLMPLRDLAEGGILAIYRDGVFARHELLPEQLESHIRRLVLRDTAEREGEHAVRRERLTRLGPLVRDAILPFLAAGEWARVLASEPGDDGFALVWTLHRFAPGESLDDLELEPESGYQEVFPVGEDGTFVDHYATRDRECLRLVCWEVPSQSTRWLRLRLADRSVELFF